METDAFSRHHAELEDRIGKLLRCADGGDCQDLAEQWNVFEVDLERHFDLEERELFPAFGREHPDDVLTLRKEHEDLRRDLLALGIRTDLHFLRADAVRDFVRSLRAHSEREEAILYPWAGRRLSRSAWAKIAAALTHPEPTGDEPWKGGPRVTP